MNRDSVSWRGYWPAAPTPFAADGEVDLQALRALMTSYVRAGVHGVLVNGSSGEWWAQSDAERRLVAETAIEAVDGMIPVIVGCTSFTAAGVVSLADHARTAGASGALSTPPPYAHPTQQEIVEFYREIDAGIDLPLAVYNWPRGTAVEIETDTAMRISEFEHVVAFKNSTSEISTVLAYIEALAGQVRIFASLINPAGHAIMRGLGGDGYIDGGGLGAPFAVPFFEAFWAGDDRTARALAVKYGALTASLVHSDFSGRFGAPSAQLKAAMAMLGQPGGHVRRPLLPVDDPRLVDELRAVLTTAGLVGAAPCPALAT